MNNANFAMELPKNEPVLQYSPGSPEREILLKEVEEQAAMTIEIPLIIAGKEYFTKEKKSVVEPHNHKNVIANFSLAGEKELNMAIEAAEQAKEEWEAMPFEHRASIFLKAAELISGPYRMKLSASTMLCQSKNAYEAEIDAICELADFLRFNSYYLQEIYKQQPGNTSGVWNRVEYRPLDGFVAAISPFNFTSIGGNLCTAPAMAGNTVVWKPSSTAVFSNYYFMKILMEAGLPAGVINFVPCNGRDYSKYVLNHKKLAGFHFTGSTEVFSNVWKQVGENIQKYESYPRLVGETGGKDFIFAHATANIDALTSAIVRGAFAYQGQKCSAASRAYIPESIWDELKNKLKTVVSEIHYGDIRDFSAFLNAVIDKNSYENIKKFQEFVKNSEDAEFLCGGKCDDKVGYFVDPTIVVAKRPDFKTMVDEIFGPIITIYVYPDEKLEETVAICNTSTNYALTGAIFADDRNSIVYLEKALSHAAGNFYINDKPTGAVVGQQPFGGGRASGTNDKAGSAVNLYRWLSQRTIKEVLNPELEVTYLHMK